MSKVARACPICDTEFTTYVSASTVGKVYCSHECRWEADKRERQSTQAVCEVCGRPRPRQNKTYCSNACRLKSIRKGANAISSNGYDRNFSEEFRNQIRTRDNDTCAMCAIAIDRRYTDKHWRDRIYGCVHHIDGNKTQTSMRNCILLCNKCHGMVHYHMAYWQPVLYALVSRRVAVAAAIAADD